MVWLRFLVAEHHEGAKPALLVVLEEYCKA
jgi:hypothetical protein